MKCCDPEEEPDPGRWVTSWDSGLPPMATIEVTLTDNPVVAVLLGPDGEPILEVRERPPIGYR